MGAADDKYAHRAEGINNATAYRERMFAIAIAAKITREPDYCPKCHAPPHCFVRYPHSLECVCGWTGYFPTSIEVDEAPLEPPRTLQEKRRDAGYSRMNGMPRTSLLKHMADMRARQKK